MTWKGMEGIFFNFDVVFVSGRNCFVVSFCCFYCVCHCVVFWFLSCVFVVARCPLKLSVWYAYKWKFGCFCCVWVQRSKTFIVICYYADIGIAIHIYDEHMNTMETQKITFFSPFWRPLGTNLRKFVDLSSKSEPRQLGSAIIKHFHVMLKGSLSFYFLYTRRYTYI